MDAQKIVNKGRDQDQRINRLCVHLTIQVVTDGIHRGRRIVWHEQGEQNEGAVLVISRADEIMRILKRPPIPFSEYW